MLCKICETNECTDGVCLECGDRLHFESSTNKSETLISERRVVSYHGIDYLLEFFVNITGDTDNPQLDFILEPTLRRWQ